MIYKMLAELVGTFWFTVCVRSWSGPYALQYACRASLDLMLYNMRVELVWTLWFTSACGASLDLTMEYGVLFTSNPPVASLQLPCSHRAVLHGC